MTQRNSIRILSLAVATAFGLAGAAYAQQATDHGADKNVDETAEQAVEDATQAREDAAQAKQAAQAAAATEQAGAMTAEGQAQADYSAHAANEASVDAQAGANAAVNAANDANAALSASQGGTAVPAEAAATAQQAAGEAGAAAAATSNAAAAAGQAADAAVEAATTPPTPTPPPPAPAPVVPTTVAQDQAPSSAVTGSTTRIDAQGNPVTISSHLPVPPARDHRAAFEAIDGNGDGRVDRSEAAGDKYLLRAYGELDTDGSGGLDYEEMLVWLDD